MRGRLSHRTVDPFDWTEERLLLAESFARLDLDDRATAKRWFARHGAVDRAGFVGAPSEVPQGHLWEWMADRGPYVVADHRSDIEVEQANIIWHLATLARLSETRLTMEWDPAWGQLIVDGSEGQLTVGGPDAGATLKSRLFIESLRRHRDTADDELVQLLDEQTRLQEAIDGWPIVEVGESLWYDSWERDIVGPAGKLPWEPSEKAKVLGTSWEMAVALERLLIAPYVSRAVERLFMMTFEPQEVREDTRNVLVPHELRLWQSILAPIYLQLFEALRRITEGEPGATICQECGRPFLVLDARRRLFCNKREGFRHAKREQRKRLAVTSSRPFDVGSAESVEEGGQR